MRLVAWLMLCVCAVAADVQSHNVTRRESGSGSGKRVVCYYTNWSVYRPGTAKFSPQNINPYLCTHLIYAFGGLTRENSLRPYDKYQDIEQGGYAKFTGLKTYNKQLKTMLAIGGWNEGSTRFSPLVADEERRGELVHNVVRFLRQNHFDGLDLDWEYPAFRDGGKPRDRANYALFVQELRAEFDRETAKTGRPRLLLTMAVPAGIEYIDKGYDIPKLNRYLDFMNILSYDYHSAFEPAVNHHSPLYPLEEDSEYNFDAQLSIDYTINHYMKLGADRDKLVLGIPTYGRSYTLFNPLATEIGAPADGPGEQGDATREKGYLAYYEICESLKSDDWKVEHPNPDAMGPYAYKGNQWVGYDDIDIVKQKSRYVSENGLGGIMFWAIDNDDFRGNCHGRPYPLIEAGKEAMLASSGTSNDVVSVVPSRGSSKMRQKHISSSSSSSSSSNVGSGSGRQGPQSEHRTHKKRPSGRRHHDKTVRSTTTSPTTSTSTTPVYNYPQNTPEPPTTPDPGSDFKCKDEGFFPHPRDCKKYFWCLDSGPSNLGIVAHQFTCPSGLFFNKGADSCDYARNVVCKKKSGDAGGSTTTKAPPITAATSRTTRISSSTASTTTTTTSTTPEPEIEEEYEDEEYEDEEEEEPAVQEDPQAIKELIILIKKLGGVEQLEKQFHLHDSDQDIKSGQVSSGFSRSLYDRVLSRSNNRGNSAFSGDDSPTTPRYTSVYRNRPVKPQNEGLEGLDEVRTLRRDKPQYVTIQRDRSSTPVPEDEEEEDEEEEEDVPITNNERDRGEDARSQASPVEYVTIRRARPTTSVDTDSTTPRYITIQRTRKPAQEPEVDDSDRDLDVQDITTEIRPVYTSTTEKQPGARIQIVTPSRKGVIEKETSYRKGSRDEELEDATLEPELKVSEGRGEFRGKPSGTYPQYVDVTSIGRRRQSTTPEAQVDSTTPIPPPEDPIPYVEVNSITRSRNTDLNSDTTGSASSSTSPLPLLIETQPQYVDITSLSRRRGTTTSSSAIQEEDPATTTPKTSNKNYPKYKSRLHSTVLTYSDAPTPAPETQQQKYKHINSILRRRSTTEVPINDIPLSEAQPIDIDTDPNIQTIPPQITTPITLPETTPSPSVPETLPTPTTTKFTPTVTRIITSVTESGTTERQRIAVNRVPYIAIAALRGETVYPGPAIQNRYPTVPIDQRILHPTTEATSPFQPESFSPVEQNTIPVTIPNEHKLEKVMEVNRITLVTLKEELPLAYTRTLSGNETTERILVDGTSEKTMDKLSEVTRFKYVTFVGGSQTTSPVDDYVTDVLPEVVSTLPTPVGTPPETTDHENAIDTQNDLQSAKPHYYSSTSRFNLDPYVTDSLPVTESLVPGVTAKQTESTVATLETNSTDITLSSVSTFSLKRQGEGRKPGVDDFKRRRTRPTFSTTSVNVDSSTPSTFSQKRRGQYKRPRPYRPTSTTVADGEADVSPSPDDSNVADESVVDRNNEPRRTFVPNSGLRKRPRPYRPTSTSTTSADEVKSPEGNDGSGITESVSDTTVQLIPKRGNRKRGTTQKPTTETSTATSTTTSYEEEIGELSTTVEAVKELDESFTVISEEGDILDSPQNEKSSTQSLDISSPENMSKVVPKRGNVSTELNLKTTLSDDVEPIFVNNSTEANTLDSSQNDNSNTQGLDVSSPHNRTKFFPKKGNKIGTSSTESNLKSTFSDEVEAISIDNSTVANTLDSSQNDKSSTQGLDVSSPQNRSKFFPKRGNKIGTSSTESNLKSTFSDEVEAISNDNSTVANTLYSSQNDKSSTQGSDASIPQNRSKVLPKRGNKIGTSSTESNLNSTFLDEVEAISIDNSTEANTLHSSQNDKSSTRGLDTGPQNRSKFYPRRGNRIGTGSTVTSLKSTTFSDDVETSFFNNSTEANILDSSKNDKSSTQGLDTSPQNRLKLYPKRGNKIRTVSTESNLKSTSLSDDVETSSINNSTEANTLDSSQTDQSGTQRLDTSPQNRSKLYPRRGNRVGTVSTESNLKSTSLSDDVETSSIKSYPNTTSTSPEVDSKSGVIDYNTDLNSTGTHTNKSVSDTKDAVEGTTFRPPSPSTSTDSVTPASVDNGSGQGDRVRIKKRRRRPVTRSSTQTTPTDSKGEGKASVVNNQQETQNEIDRDQTTTSPSSSYDPEQTAATSFATAALLGRDHYEVSTPGSGGEFLTTVDREGKHMVKISVLNNPNDKFVVQKGQKSKSSDDYDKSNARNSTAPNPSNDSTTEDNDLSTDGSAYATANIGRNSFLTLSASVKSSSEEIRNSFMTATVEFPTEGPSEGRKNSKATVKASTRQQPKDYFIASVDFTTDSGDVETLGPTRKPDASGRKKPGSDGKSRRLVRRKRPSTTTVEPQVQSEVVTTTTRSLRRPTGALYTPNRLRQRSTTTTSTTETPVSSTAEPQQQRRKPGARLVRRRKYGSPANRTSDSDATASGIEPLDASSIAPSDKAGSGGLVRKYSFPRRRATTTPPPVTTTLLPITTLLPNDTPEPARGDMQLLESKEHQSTEADAEQELTTTKLPDLANAAVIAIHNLATVPPTTLPAPEIVKTTRTTPAPRRSSQSLSSTPLIPRRGSAVFVSEQPIPSPPSPRRLTGSGSLRPRPFSKTTPNPVPTTSPRAQTSRPRPPPIIDYEYYDDDDVGILDVAPVSGKVKIHSDGYIECLDRGNFPHPFSCKKFISCAKMENGELLGWEYTCPRQLSFDPIGGICNWSAGLGCKE